MARIGSSGSGGAVAIAPSGDVDGGFANSVYLVSQVVDGGNAFSG